MRILLSMVALIVGFSFITTVFTQTVKVRGAHVATSYFDAYLPAAPNSVSSDSCVSSTTVASDYATAYIPQGLSNCHQDSTCDVNISVATSYINAYKAQSFSDCS